MLNFKFSSFFHDKYLLFNSTSFLSVLKCNKKAFEMIGRKKIKKNCVALHIVNFGEEDEEKLEKLEALLL